jgi:hypothetical protein
LRLKGRIRQYTKTISINRLSSELRDARGKKADGKSSAKKQPSDTSVANG